ncbi:SusF/SusE family outer membrane protein [Catenovulum sp. 2E275]|uniref:SusF/SusE family outer membrane protein n=1 Tax=Catenovulum sp. 2E275 TaxID=2980497 RepID=UPI0021D05609|nr:SusF/SusE family outer membrane protein [Catenovulum sp. 2E275]MCU4677392.1 SusF/SusE family outer membrane protein [Catenovulum sp. 2E275]
MNIERTFPLLLLSSALLAACGKGADDISFQYNPDAVISENASNEYVEPPRAPDNYKVIYYVDAGDGTPGKLETLETFGTRSSVEDQAYGVDASTGYKWGYTSPVAQYYSDADNYGSIRGDERDMAGAGIEYSFEVENGSYTVVFGFNDPWDSEGTRHVDLLAEEQVLEAGYYIPVDNEYKRYDNVEVTDGELQISIRRTASNSDSEADPQISWIEIWGETDEDAAAPVANVWITGDFQTTAWDWGSAPQMKPLGDDWYEMVVHFQNNEGGFEFLDQNEFSDKETWGASSEGATDVVYSVDAAAIKVDAAGYYTIKFNISSLDYSVESLDTSALTDYPEMYVIGKGFSDYPELDWGVDQAIPLTKNFRGLGEDVFGIEGLQFSDAVELKIISQRSWDDLDIGFVDAAVYNAEGADFYWGETIAGQGTPNLAYNGAAGAYTLIFDYAANRATLFKSRMYMVGAGSIGDWDVGQAVEMNQIADGWYELALRYTKESDGNAIKPYGDFKFVSAQNWNAGNFGLSDVESDLTLMENSSSSDGVPAPAPGYYTVRFNPSLLSYSIEAIDLSQHSLLDELYIVGKGFVDYPELDWSVENSIPMIRDINSSGDYVFGIECLQLSDEVDMKFVGQLDWDGLDAGFVNGGEQTAPIVWAKADIGSGTSDLKLNGQAGFYDVTFDYLIERISVMPNTSCQ